MKPKSNKSRQIKIVCYMNLSKLFKIFAYSTFVYALFSCENEIATDTAQSFLAEEEILPKTRSFEVPMLSFNTLQEYQQLVDSLSYLSDSELLKWEKTNPGFTSLYRVHSQAMEEISNASSIQEYNQILANFDECLIFNTEDFYDFSVYLPTLNMGKAITMNEKGLVKIGNDTIDVRDFLDFDGYVNEYSQKFPSTTKEETYIVENGINTCSVEIEDRKFSAVLTFNMGRQLLYVTAAKTFLWGWIQYKTAYYVKATPDGPEFCLGEYKSGSSIPVQFANNSDVYMFTRGTGYDHYARMRVSN